jgi:hypothetical protein
LVKAGVLDKQHEIFAKLISLMISQCHSSRVPLLPNLVLDGMISGGEPGDLVGHLYIDVKVPSVWCIADMIIDRLANYFLDCIDVRSLFFLGHLDIFLLTLVLCSGVDVPSDVTHVLRNVSSGNA